MEILTLEEAIDAYKAEAEQKRLDAALLYDARRFEESKDCIWKAKENEQLVKQLEELRLYRLHYDKAAERIQRKMKESNDFIVYNNERYVSFSELCEILEGKDILKEGE